MIRSARARACSVSGGAVRKYSPLSLYVVNWSDVLAGENCMTPAPAMARMTGRLRRGGARRRARGGGRDLRAPGAGGGVDDRQAHAGGRRTDDRVHARLQEAVDGLGGGVGRRVTGVTLDQLRRLAEHAAGGVDVAEGELCAGDLVGAEEGEVARQRQQRADDQRPARGAGRRVGGALVGGGGAPVHGEDELRRGAAGRGG